MTRLKHAVRGCSKNVPEVGWFIAGPRNQANSITFDIKRLEPGLRTQARAHSHRGRIPLGPPGEAVFRTSTSPWLSCCAYCSFPRRGHVSHGDGPSHLGRDRLWSHPRRSEPVHRRRERSSRPRGRGLSIAHYSSVRPPRCRPHCEPCTPPEALASFRASRCSCRTGLQIGEGSRITTSEPRDFSSLW